MKKVLLIIVLTIVVVYVIQDCKHKNEADSYRLETSQTIQKQIKNVGKLIVTEGHFAEVYNYEAQKEHFYITFDKKALAVVNAEVTIAYDLSELQYEIDDINKILHITKIPEEEIKIYPDIKFYDIDQSVFNPFTGEDYNKIQVKVKERLRKKIETSSFKSNAKNRLLSELSKIYILTNSLGWTLQYNEQEIQNEEELFQLKG